MTCGIYKIINKVNGKYYLGSSENINTRWKFHRYDLRHNKHHSIHLQRAWVKYGEASFIFEIIEEVPNELIIEKEQYYLDTFKPWDEQVGYNMSKFASGGDLISYHPNIDTIREKQRISTKKRWNMKSEEEKLEFSENMKGNGNPNWKGGISRIKFKCPICGKETNTTNKNTSTCKQCDDRNGENNSFFGKHHSEETKEKLRKSHIGKKLSKESKLKCKEASFNFYNSEEGIKCKKKMSIRNSGENHPLYGVGHTKESKIKMSNSRKEKYKNMTFEERIDRVINSKQNIKMVIANGKYYFSSREASNHLNISPTSVEFRCRSKDEKWKEFKFIDRIYVKENRDYILSIIKLQLVEKFSDETRS
jgi:group I intron endonuclease